MTTPQQTTHPVLRSKPQTLSVRSPAFDAGRAIPREHSGYGDNVSPALEFGNVPQETRALAVIVDDPDAPSGTFTHWLVWNLPGKERRLARAAHVGSVGAVEGTNDMGRVGWFGPRPPSGTHRYFFRVFALDEPLDLAEGARAAEVWRAVEKRCLAWGELMGTFSKP